MTAGRFAHQSAPQPAAEFDLVAGDIFQFEADGPGQGPTPRFELFHVVYE